MIEDKIFAEKIFSPLQKQKKKQISCRIHSQKDLFEKVIFCNVHIPCVCSHMYGRVHARVTDHYHTDVSLI